MNTKSLINVVTKEFLDLDKIRKITKKDTDNDTKIQSIVRVLNKNRKRKRSNKKKDKNSVTASIRQRPIEKERVCKKCNIVYPIHHYYVSRNKGFTSCKTCKTCIAAEKSEQYQDRKRRKLV